jgi:hypothetical protein
VDDPEPELDLGAELLYILAEDGRTPVKCAGVFAWAQWSEANRERKRVAHDVIGDATISTIFFGVDNRPLPLKGQPPQLFETTFCRMVGEAQDVEIVGRCATWEEALAMHAEVVAGEKMGGGAAPRRRSERNRP